MKRPSPLLILSLGILGSMCIGIGYRFFSHQPLRTHWTIRPSARELQLDQERITALKIRYQTTVEQAIDQQNGELCNTLPDLALPYERRSDGSLSYLPGQVDGPSVPSRAPVWPRKQCLFAFISTHDQTLCEQFFPLQEERADCHAELATYRPDEQPFRTLVPLTPATEDHLGKKTYYSTRSKQQLPYFILYPKAEVKGILLYAHGAGGDLEQGLLDETYKDSFTHLKQLLRDDLSYLYLTPALTNFGADGGQDLIDLAQEMRQRYPNIPVYLAGSSAGGKTLLYALHQSKTAFQGALALCPAVDTTLLNGDWNITHTPLRIVQGIQDQLVPVQVVDRFVERMSRFKYPVTYHKIPGDHGAPIDQAPWKEALDPSLENGLLH